MNDLSPVLDFLSSIDYKHPTGLTWEKVNNNGSYVDSQTDDDRILFEVERHHPILGAIYRPRVALSAFASYLQTYVFDPHTSDIEPLENRRYLPVDPDSIDYARLAEERVGENYRIELVADTDTYKVYGPDTDTIAEGKTKEETISNFKKNLYEQSTNHIFDNLNDIELQQDAINQIIDRVNQAIKLEIEHVTTQL